ncbi:hypothetical protein FPANT_3604 [Fusarium pseudoanthophilum]|uniref:Uncharacterized protein n=1 Tax=Fusarium pseudoanthophilum TaxID=48495 RepID=A0A8H5PLN0_9HYPO|nr:hypothetical protein FPANT_3604 [Fusarium pseudoanthophilum]
MPLPNILRLKEDKWDNPEDSIGTFIGYLRGGRYSCWEAAGPARQAFRELSPDIKDFLETSSIPPTEIVSWSMYMIGHNERNAAPKLLICSTDAKTRKNIRQLIKDSNIMGKYPGIGLGDVSSLPDRPVIRELSREAIEALLPFGCIRDGAVLANGSEPALGKRIFVVNPYDFSLRPATTGPIILQDGKCYQLTVAHAFRYTRELEHSSGQQMAEDDCDFDGMSDTERDDGSQYDEMTRKGSVTPEEIDSDKASFMTSLDASSGDKRSSSRSESPSSDHLDSGHDPRQSFESLEDNPGPSEIDVSQLQFYGRLVLSSLAGRNPSLDYALIETSRMPEDTEKSSMITGSLISSIGEIESDDISIVTRTSPHCRVEGRITATPSYIRLPEQRAFQQVYPVRLGKSLHDGDCGTAVFGKDDNRFYGHIVAGSPGTSIAYLVPAGEISKDIQARLGFGLIQMPQQHGGMRPYSTDPRLLPVKYVGFWKPPEEPPNGQPLEPREVQQWLQHRPNSQPSQNTFINSQTRIEHSRLTNDIIDYVSDVSGDISLHTSNTSLSVNEWLQGSRTEMPSFNSTPANSDRNIRYHGKRKYNEERPADSLLSRDLSTISAAGTDASPASDKLPKRQNSHSIDNSKYPWTHNSGYKGYALSHGPPASIGLVQPATSLSQKVWVDAAQETQRRTRGVPSWPSHIDPSSSNTQRDEAASSLKRRLVLPEDFESTSKVCIFWLLSPKHFSSPERHACSVRKEEISHIVTHISDHHGLIHGRDPLYTGRGYLASCQNFDPYVKAKGYCGKCESLYKWCDTDFEDLTHHGVAVCLRCWRRFDKKEMKEHLAGPLCDYNAEQPKAKKMWILYTAFCSETKLPSKPPKWYPAPRNSLRRIIGSRQRQFGQYPTAAPVDDLDGTMSVSCPSLATSTTEESMELWHSPKLSGSWVLQEEADDMAIDSLERDPRLRVTIEATDLSPLRPTDRDQELAYQIPADQNQKISGYHPENVGKMFNTQGLDIELNQGDLNDLNETPG